MSKKYAKIPVRKCNGPAFVFRARLNRRQKVRNYYAISVGVRQLAGRLPPLNSFPSNNLGRQGAAGPRPGKLRQGEDAGLPWNERTAPASSHDVQSLMKLLRSVVRHISPRMSVSRVSPKHADDPPYIVEVPLQFRAVASGLRGRRKVAHGGLAQGD